MTFGNKGDSGIRRAYVVTAAALLVAAGVLSCSIGNGEEDDRLNTPARYREMVTVVPAGTAAAVVAGSGTDGAFIEGRTVTLSAFSMAKYETTWELWEEVRAWAGEQGYSIANRGTQGHGASGTGDASKGWTREQRQRRPVTDITWRDAVVWCNAYSELSGLEPVYYKADGITVLRVSANNGPEAPSDIGTDADNTVMRRDKNGFRLPLETEWEFAARGASPDAADWNFAYSGGNDLAGIAWYDGNAYTSGSADYGVHPAGTNAGGVYAGANRLGLFDMSGNAAEWCWDWFNENGVTPTTPPDGDGPGVFAHRVTRGGSWRNGASSCAVTDRNYCRPFSSGTYLGFRVAKTERDTAPPNLPPETGGLPSDSLKGTVWIWDSAWGRRTLIFDASELKVTYIGQAGDSYTEKYTYDRTAKKGLMDYYGEAGFEVSTDNQTMHFIEWKNYGHGCDYTRLTG